ncbi:hypothetical protein C8Q74DRAFT_1306035, partial [Fomes fomentarius]
MSVRIILVDIPTAANLNDQLLNPNHQPRRIPPEPHRSAVSNSRGRTTPCIYPTSALAIQTGCSRSASVRRLASVRLSTTVVFGSGQPRMTHPRSLEIWGTGATGMHLERSNNGFAVRASGDNARSPEKHDLDARSGDMTIPIPPTPAHLLTSLQFQVLNNHDRLRQRFVRGYAGFVHPHALYHRRLAPAAQRRPLPRLLHCHPRPSSPHIPQHRGRRSSPRVTLPTLRRGACCAGQQTGLLAHRHPRQH